MVLYNFKKIQVVPTNKEFIDIVLTRTQRKTPTVIHPSLPIQRIRAFYIRKVKFTQTTFHDKLSQILEDFPRLDDIHPFYGDLMNVLYDKDHYKLALGQLNTARHLIDSVGRDYVRLLKYGDSLYRCKQLKTAALGRMCTIMRKQGSALEYLEQVRQHLARLPSIDPNTRTIILCGYPNVGKSSFMNRVTRANVDVQPYAFTTKSLFVGHTDYKYLQWQVIDTPGILDHPLEDRNTIEMQSITALAHLRACVLYIIDISEHCGYSIKTQVDLFNNIKPLFANKPIIVAVNKIDIKPYDDLPQESKDLLQSILTPEVEMIPMSTLTEIGVSEVKAKACEKLLTHRVETKLKTQRKVSDILNRIHVAEPVQRDESTRSISIPQSVLEARSRMSLEAAEGQNEGSGTDSVAQKKRRTERDIEAEEGGPGVYSVKVSKWYDLTDPEWKDDVIPEIINGRNIADYVDPEIMQKLAKLEAEEEQALTDLAIREQNEDAVSDLDEEEKATLDKIRTQRKIRRINRLTRRTQNHSIIPRKFKAVDIEAIAAELARRGVEKNKIEEARENSATVASTSSAASRARSRSQKRLNEQQASDEDMERGRVRSRSKSSASRTRSSSKKREEWELERARSRSMSEARQLEEARNKPDTVSLLGKRTRSSMTPSRFIAPTKNDGIKNPRTKIYATKRGFASQRFMNQDARQGEADRHVYDLKPKHLLSGKRTIGKTERR